MNMGAGNPGFDAAKAYKQEHEQMRLATYDAGVLDSAVAALVQRGS